MTLEAGSKVGPYEIVTLIGEGGMGQVYRARDPRLGREVAIKVVSEQFSERFDREAHVVAALNHPNICSLYDVGPNYLVMELVEGPTLQERLAEAPIPFDETMAIARQIADALEAAHEKDIIHRDLKPANIKIKPDGMVKVLDFGLAKLADAPVRHSDDSPTFSLSGTRSGVILGTAGFMSPEQARGKPVDKRSDIWAFGAVLYEMLTRKRLFQGDTISDTLAAVLTLVPDWQALPSNTPPNVRFVLRRCLEKDASRRFHHAADVRIVLDAAPELSAPAGPGRRAIGPKEIILGVAALVAAFALGFAVWLLRPTSQVEPAPIVRFQMGVLPAEHMQNRPAYTAIAFSPDGRSIVYSAERAAPVELQLYSRALDRAEATPLRGTEGAEGPFFSPDGQWIGFWASGELRRTPAAGGPPVSICKLAAPPFGASWGSTGTIVFARMDGGLWRVPSAGGEPKPLTTLDADRNEWSHRLPTMLPGDKAVLFTITRRQFPSLEETDIAVQSLGSGRRKILVHGGADARFLSTGHILYVRQGTLMAVPFDLARLEITGSAVGMVDDIMQAVNTTSPTRESAAAQVALSATGSIAFLTGGIQPDRKYALSWMDRNGASRVFFSRQGVMLAPRLSPDGRKLAFFAVSQAEHSVWIYDLVRGVSSRLTSDYGAFPVWSPDGTRIAYENRNLFWQPIDGSAKPERLATGDLRQFPGVFTPDGKTLIFVQTDSSGSSDIYTLSLQGDHRSRPLVQSPADEAYPDLSPDGHWLVYESNESGRSEVYVQAFPGPGGKQQISVDGGTQPVWDRNGRKLYYLEPSSYSQETAMLEVEVSATTTFKAGTPRVLLRGRLAMGLFIRPYDITPDGHQFVMAGVEPSESPAPATEMHVILNWAEELKRRVPTSK